MKTTIFLCLLLFAGLALSETEHDDPTKDVKPVRGVFEVRRFFYDSVLKREYGDQLDVKFIPGANPELVLYDAEDQEISRTAINRMKFDELHELVQAYGFTKVTANEEEQKEAEEAQSADSSASSQQEL